jgi:hypothetical protein
MALQAAETPERHRQSLYSQLIQSTHERFHSQDIGVTDRVRDMGQEGVVARDALVANLALGQRDSRKSSPALLRECRKAAEYLLREREASATAALVLVDTPRESHRLAWTQILSDFQQPLTTELPPGHVIDRVLLN